MKNIVNTMTAILCVGFTSIAFSKTPDQDVFQACMSQTRQDRLTCIAGCGMIFQQCYDQDIADLNGKITTLLSQIKLKNGDSCANLADSYLSDATRMESDVGQKANDVPGWIGSKLALNFAKQRLDTLRDGLQKSWR